MRSVWAGVDANKSLHHVRVSQKERLNDIASHGLPDHDGKVHAVVTKDLLQVSSGIGIGKVSVGSGQPMCRRIPDNEVVVRCKARQLLVEKRMVGSKTVQKHERPACRVKILRNPVVHVAAPAFICMFMHHKRLVIF